MKSVLALALQFVPWTDLSRNLDRPVFVWGAPRSGTTLLYEMLARHPDAGFPVDKANRPREGTDFWWRVFGEHRGEMGVSLAVRHRARDIRRAYGRLLKIQNRRRLLDKTPFMTLWIPLVNEVFPDARHIHIIRDGRAVVNSILFKLRHSNKDKDAIFREQQLVYGPLPAELADAMDMPPALRHARQWRMLVETGRNNASLLGDRYLELRYEDLVEHTAENMRNVLEHAQWPIMDEFIARNYQANLESRNYKWNASPRQVVDDGFTSHRALDEADVIYLDEMNTLLRTLGYLQSDNNAS